MKLLKTISYLLLFMFAIACNSESETILEYDSDGNKRYEFTYLNGEKNGSFEAYYPNGDLEQKGNYADDHRAGKFTSYNEDGDKVVTITYEFDGERSVPINKEYFVDESELRPDGDIEVINGVNYLWMDGIRSRADRNQTTREKKE